MFWAHVGLHVGWRSKGFSSETTLRKSGDVEEDVERVPDKTRNKELRTY